jgi:hypothetical protein
LARGEASLNINRHDRLQLSHIFAAAYFYQQTTMDDTNALSSKLFWTTLQIHLESKDADSRKLSFMRLKHAYEYMNPTDEPSEDPCVQDVKNFLDTVASLYNNKSSFAEDALGKLLINLETLKPSRPDENFELLLDLVISNHNVAFLRDDTGERNKKSDAAFKAKEAELVNFM